MQVRKLKTVKVYSRNRGEPKEFATRWRRSRTEYYARSVPDEAVRGVDIVFTATNSSVPVFDGNWWNRPTCDDDRRQQCRFGERRFYRGQAAGDRRRNIIEKPCPRHRVDSTGPAGRTSGYFDPVNRGVIKWEQLIEIGAILAGNNEGRTQPRPDHLLQKQRRPRRGRRRAGSEGVGEYQS